MVDDSQMFGGLLSAERDLLPCGLKILGDHGGFVGSGIGYASGVQLAEPDATVFCFLGDHGFANGFQALLPVAENRIPVIFVVANNQGSVSLSKQSGTLCESEEGWITYDWLKNPSGWQCHQVAASMGIESSVVDLTKPGEAAEPNFGELEERLKAAVAHRSQAILIELLLPSDPEFWDGIWETTGFEPE